MIEEHRGATRITRPSVDERTRRVLLLGECNPQSDDPRHALWPDPPGCAGHRLRDIMGVDGPTYLSYWRTNLCNPTWDSKDAMHRAWELLLDDCPWTTIVMLGRKVEKSMRFFGAIEIFGSRLVERELPPDVSHPVTLVSLPHPSGVCREWNEIDAVPRARKILRETGVIA